MSDTGNLLALHIMILMCCTKRMTVMYTSSLIPIFHMTDTQSDDNLLVRHECSTTYKAAYGNIPFDTGIP